MGDELDVPGREDFGPDVKLYGPDPDNLWHHWSSSKFKLDSPDPDKFWLLFPKGKFKL